MSNTPNGRTRVRDLRPAVSLNLDTLEREGGVPEPFTVAQGNRQFVFRDSQEIDWQVLTEAAEKPVLFIRAALSEDDADAFLKLDIPTWKFAKLIEQYQAHYGLPSAGE